MKRYFKVTGEPAKFALGELEAFHALIRKIKETSGCELFEEPSFPLYAAAKFQESAKAFILMGKIDLEKWVKRGRFYEPRSSNQKFRRSIARLRTYQNKAWWRFFDIEVDFVRWNSRPEITIKDGGVYVTIKNETCWDLDTKYLKELTHFEFISKTLTAEEIKSKYLS